jgi:uncharacterized RDD family membrane protein YckC
VLSEDEEVRSAPLASVGQRFLARLLDGLILAVPGLVLVAPFLHLHDDGTFSWPLWNELAFLAMGAAYEISFIALRGQTLGKSACKVRVVPANGTGEPPGWGAAAIRYLVPAVVAALKVVGIFVLLVYGWAVFDRHRQGLHDKAAGTLVVRAAPTR